MVAIASRVVGRRRTNRREARRTGLEAAVGMPTERREVPTGEIGRCPVCETVARIDMIDATTGRGYFSCNRCGKEWQSERSDADSERSS